MRKYLISNNNLKQENICFLKNIFSLKFENPRWQIKAIVASDQHLVKKRYMKVKLSQFYEHWKSFRNQGLINLS